MDKNTLEGQLVYKGARGDSAYEIAVKNGFKGTEEAWLEQIGFEEINAKLPIDVRNFGAKGDGVTDDTEAIQNALTFANNNNYSVYFPKGTYLLNSYIELLSSCKLTGEKAVITGCGIRTGKNLSIEVYISGMIFKDIKENAIDVDGNNLIVENCEFDNIGINPTLNPSYQGMGIYIGNGFELTVKNSKFNLCRGHGAIFTNGDGYVDITENYFNDNLYRAIDLNGSSAVVSGIIKNNHIEDCGKSNTTGSAVGCNGIYSMSGKQLILSHNTIVNSRENAIEGFFKIIDSNIIDGTNIEMDTKPTPSVEGIYLWSDDVIVTNNHLKNIKKRGIATVNNESENNYKALIQNNIIDEIEEYDGEAYSIYFLSTVGVSNKTIINNVLSNKIYLEKSLNNNTYIGDLKFGTNVNNMITPNLTYSFFHKFDSIEPFTYGNCSPEIIESGLINKKVIHIDYQQYNKLKSPVLPNSTRSRIDMNIYCRGNFHILLHKDDVFFMSLETIKTEKFTEFNIKNLFDKAITDDVYIWFVPVEGSYLEIANISYNVIYE